MVDPELTQAIRTVTEQQEAESATSTRERRIVPPVIPPAVDAASVTEREAQERNSRLWARWLSLVEERGSRYGGVTLDTFDAALESQQACVAKLRAYCESICEHVRRGRGILLYGPKGTGKDHLAMSACRYAVRADLSVKWQNGMDLFGDMRDLMDGSGSERGFVQRFVKPDILYLSDPLPPVGRVTEFQASMLFRILDARYSRRKPLIVTVNVSGGAELDERLGPQNADRLRDGALALFCNWASARKAKQ